MTDQELLELANAKERPHGACPYAWWISPFVIDSKPVDRQKLRRRKEEQLELFETEESRKNIETPLSYIVLHDI